MAESLKEKLLASARAAADAGRGMRESQGAHELQRHLKAYVNAKFLLDDVEEDSIDELVAMSIARALKLDKKLLAEVDNAAECTGSTSAMRKKVLLIMSLQKSIGFELDPSETAGVETLEELADMIFRHMKERG